MLRHAPKEHVPEAWRLAGGGERMCVALRETVGGMDADDKPTWTYSRRVSRRDTHIRCAPPRKQSPRVEASAGAIDRRGVWWLLRRARSEEHTSELQSLMRISYAVFCLKKKKKITSNQHRI